MQKFWKTIKRKLFADPLLVFNGEGEYTLAYQWKSGEIENVHKNKLNEDESMYIYLCKMPKVDAG